MTAENINYRRIMELRERDKQEGRAEAIKKEIKFLKDLINDCDYFLFEEKKNKDLLLFIEHTKEIYQNRLKELEK